MSRVRRFAAVCLVIISVSCAANAANAATAPHVRTFRSPDGRLVARIQRAGKTVEEVVEIRAIGGKLLCRRSYVSADGTHGLIVVQAAWTPNSKFFVWSMESSGGHQPWCWPTDFYDAARSRAVSLDRATGLPVTSGDFSVKAPDVVITKVMVKSGDISGVTRSFKLTGLGGVQKKPERAKK